jgi:hypothetical protein
VSKRTVKAAVLEPEVEIEGLRSVRHQKTRGGTVIGVEMAARIGFI